MVCGDEGKWGLEVRGRGWKGNGGCRWKRKLILDGEGRGIGVVYGAVAMGGKRGKRGKLTLCSQVTL